MHAGSQLMMMTSPPSPHPAGASSGNTGAAAATSSRYENQKRRDWNTFCQYQRNHRPPLSLPMCSEAHVLEFLRYLDQRDPLGRRRSAMPRSLQFL
ncbi:unnamed protein product [Linum trigynum]